MRAITSGLSVEQFLELPEPPGQRIELIEGEVLAMPLGGYEHERTKANWIQILSPWLLEHPIGVLFVETGFRLDAHTALIPDLSLVLNHRLVPRPETYIQGAPELAIEVVSSESAAQLEKKVRLYFAHGARAVWASFPSERVLRVYDRSGASHMLEPHQFLQDPELLPGFRVLVSGVFEGL